MTEGHNEIVEKVLRRLEENDFISNQRNMCGK